MPSRSGAAGPWIALLLLVAVPLWPLATLRGVPIPDDIFTSDLMNGGLAYRALLGEFLRRGELPLWTPSFYGGFPFLALAEAGACYPPNLILFGLLPPYEALALSVLLTFFIAAAGMYLFARALGAGTPGALLAAASFAWSGFLVSHVRHLSMAASVAWFPFGLLAIERALRGGGAVEPPHGTPGPGGPRPGRPLALLWLGVVLGLQILSGYVQTAYYSVLVYAGWFLVRLPGRGAPAAARRARIRLASGFCLALIAGAGIGAALLLPTRELVSRSQRAGGVSFEYASQYAYDPANLVTFVLPYARGDIGRDTYRGRSVFWEDYAYVGLVTLLLAGFAVAAGWRRGAVAFFAVAALIAYLLALGPRTPLFELAFRMVPGMNLFRFPTRFLFVVDAALAVLAALGLSRLAARGRALPWVALALGVLDLLTFQPRQIPIVAAGRWRSPPAVVEVLRRDPDLFRTYSPGATVAHEAAFERARGWQDLTPYVAQREFLQPNLGALHGLTSADGYAQLAPTRVVDVWGDQNREGLIVRTAEVARGTLHPRPAFARVLSLFNVKYVLSAWPIAGSEWEAHGRFGDAFLYRNPGVMPRAFLVPGFRLARGRAEAESVLVSDGFDPRREAILYRAPRAPPSTAAPGTARIERYAAAEVRVSTSSDSAALLVLSDTHYPGWVATVDGRETEILEANLCMRAVEVPPGRHEVLFRFRSVTATAGLALTALSTLAVGLALALATARGRRRAGIAR